MAAKAAAKADLALGNSRKQNNGNWREVHSSSDRDTYRHFLPEEEEEERSLIKDLKRCAQLAFA